jgi:hypothetical protein
MALMPTNRMGPPPGASPPMHDCIMVRIKRSYRIQVSRTKMRLMASFPRILTSQTDRHPPDAEL